MSFKTIIKNFIDNRVEEKFDKKFDKYFQISLQQREFESANDEFLASKVESKTDIKNIIHRFEQIGIIIERQKINIDDFKEWMLEYSKVTHFYKKSNEVKIEKLLEHYLTFKYLNIKKSGTYIDIAASSSLFADIMKKNCNISYRQDLIYKKGINGNKIGSDAGSMPLENNSVDVMTLHCAYECFQGDSDVNFIIEAQRVLKKNGRLGIVPLYIDDIYFIKSGVKCDKRKIKFDKEARQIWRDDIWQEPFSRHYSPESFNNRIIKNIKKLNYKILYFTNLSDLEDEFKNQKIYCHFMFYAEKK